MRLQQRRNFFMIFAIFFVVCLPFLILFSLGFTFSIRDPEIKNSLSVRIQTTPSNASIYALDELKGKTPTELSIQDGQNINLKIDRKDYLSEQFSLTADANQNSFVDLSSLWLLPSSGESFEDIGSSPVQIVSESLVIIKKREKYMVQSFGLAGYDNAPETILNELKPSAKSINDTNLNDNLTSKLLNKETFWKKISDNIYYKDSLVLHRRDGFWQLNDLESENQIKASTILRLNDRFALVLDKDQKIWLLNLENNQTRFVDESVNAIASVGQSNGIWVWRDNAIHKINPEDIINSRINWTGSILLKNGLISDEIGGKFDVQNLFQGVVVQVGKYLFYVPDYKDMQWQLLSNDVQLMATENETIFWLDSDNNLTTQNLFNGNKRYLITLESTPNNFGYIKDWDRLVFYYNDKVDSIWYNKEIINKGVRNYSFNNWIKDNQCFPKLINRVQYCLKDNSLVVYKNNAFF